MSMFRSAILALATCSALAAAQTQPPPAIPATPPSPADSAIRIVLLTMGQGDQVYEMFGHNAIWVHDPLTRTDSVYNWGVFDFRTPGFLVRFLLGDMRYTMAADDIRTTLAIYQSLNRRVWAQELALTPSEKRSIVDFIRWNSLPENRQYRYDYYLDNCSTRVRDIIDRALGGSVRTYLASIPTEETYRSHSLRLMQTAPLLVSGVETVLGRRTDTKLSADQASFLPVQLMEHLRGFKRPDGRPLIAREQVFSEAARGPEPANVPALWKGMVPIGIAIGVLLLGLGLGLRARIPTATLVAIVAGLMGLVGLIMLLLVTITDHVAAHANENMWLLNPVWLVVAVVLPRAILRQRWTRLAKWSVLAGAALGVCAVLMHLGLSRQPNWDVIGLFLPAQLAMAAVTLSAAKGAVTLSAAKAAVTLSAAKGTDR
jgi:hypothetical protein